MRMQKMHQPSPRITRLRLAGRMQKSQRKQKIRKNMRYDVDMFTLHATTALGRRGTLTTAHGVIETPFFMPVGTAGAMKGLTHEDLLKLGAQILLCNTYHLKLQPGDDVIRDAGGLHAFIGWDLPILTDSGGFQVFSLRNLSEISDDGVHFRSHINGDPFFLGPEESMRIQHNFGSDIIMCFDECPPSTAKRSDILKAVDRTLAWAKQCKKIHNNLSSLPAEAAYYAAKAGASSVSSASSLFAIIQGGLERDLREKCAQELIAIGFDGYALGGLAVGESPDEMLSVLDTICPLLPEDKPRYLMGVGVIEQMRACVARGIDMFDCVLPMRIARHGTLLLSNGSQIRIQNACFRDDHSVIDADSPSTFSRIHKKSYLHHLFKAKERLSETIASMQNLGVTLHAMRDLQKCME